MEDYSFILTNDAARIEPLQKDLEAVLKADDVRPRVIYPVIVALGEWLENVIQYAYPNGAVHQISVQCTIDDTEILVRVTDDGKEFDPGQFPALDTTVSTPQSSAAGRGIHLIRHLMNRVEHQRRDGKNILVMTKHLAP